MTLIDFTVWLEFIKSSLASVFIILIILAFGFVVDQILPMILKSIVRRMTVPQSIWEQKMDEAFATPLRTIVWTITIFLVVSELLLIYPHPEIQEKAASVFKVALILELTWIILRWKRVFFQALAKSPNHHKIDINQYAVLNKLSTIFATIVVLFLLLQACGLNIVPLLAFGGIGAATVGFAAKDVLANFFGGLMLSIASPFKIGDKVIALDQKIQGHVIEIGWYLTSIRGEDKRLVYVPNALFSSMMVTNASRITHRRISEKIHLSYPDATVIPKIIKEIKDYLFHNPEVDLNERHLLGLEQFGEWSTDLLLDFYHHEKNEEIFFRKKEQILLDVLKIIQNSGVKVAIRTL